MKDTKNLTRFITLVALIFAAAFSRFIPHPPNFAPILAIALFGGAYFNNRIMAFAVPLIAMLASDLVFGFHSALVFVYLSFAAAVLLGMLIRNRKSAVGIAGLSIASSVIFYIVTNFGVWLGFGLYPMNLAGLIECYAMALPFFKYTLAATLIYSTALFGGFELIKRLSPAIKAEANANAA
jgi:hypothetical protein